MTERDPLQAYFRAGDVPASDPGFRLDVMEAVATRRFRLELAQRMAAVALVVVMALLLAPVVGNLLDPFTRLFDAGLATVALLLAVMAALAGQVWLSRGSRFSLPRLF